MSEEIVTIMKILSIDEAAFFASGKKVVIITGVTGMDGSFLTDYLLKNTEYEIFGGARRLSVSNHENILHLENEKRFHLINFDLTDPHSISQVISQMKPDYFVNFAAQSFVKSSWDFPLQTWETNTTGVLHILEAIRLHKPNCRFYNAGSSEEFGNATYSPQDENHPLRPRSPYGASKSGARHLVKVFRESYGLYAVQGWLFNHEGTRRGEEFVTRKITKAVARINKAIEENKDFDPLELGNIDVFRDWSDAEDSVIAVWKMLNQDSSNIKEYVVSSNECHSVREFVEKAFTWIGIHGTWIGENIGENYMATINGEPKCIVSINANHYRPAEVDSLLGNSTLIRKDLGWEPKTTFDKLIEKMVRKDITTA